MSPLLAMVLLAIPVPVAVAPSVSADPTVLRDQIAAVAPAGTASHVDPASGVVVVKLGGQPSGQFLSTVAGLPGKVRVEQAAPVRPLANFWGGVGISNSAGATCTAGFVMKQSDNTPFVTTAGHCLSDNVRNWYYNGALIGPAYAYSYPGNDYGVIMRVFNSSIQPNSNIIYHGAKVRVNVVVNTPIIGWNICKTGNITGTTCGTILATNVSVTYHGGEVVTGLIETSACGAPGDSGSPMFRDPGDRRLQGIGVLSGGNLFPCGDPSARTYYNPLSEIASAYGLTLLTNN